MSRRSRKPKADAVERRAVSVEQLEQILASARTRPLDDSEHTTLKAAVDTLALVTQELQSKQTSLQRLRRLLFGARTEKTDVVLGQADEGSEATRPAQGRKGKPKKRKGHGRNGAAAYPRAERVGVAHASLGAGDPCPAPGCEGGKLYRQRKAPALLVRVSGVAPLKAIVYELERLRCHLCGTVFTAEAPAGVGPAKYDETAAAMIGLLKYGCGLPFNRLQRLQHDLGMPLPAPTQWEVVQRAAGSLEIAYRELVRQGAQAEVLHNDDTSARVLEMTAEARAEALPAGAREDRTGVFTTGIVATTETGHRIALFMTGPRHAGENLASVLEHREPARAPPIHMSDGLSRNPPGEHPTVAASCMPHARRQYVDVAAHFPEQCRYVLETLREVFHQDKIAREQRLSPEARLKLHQRKSAALMDELEQWMKKQFDERRVEPNSGLGQAISYMQNRWEELTVFLRVAGAPLDNNICERALKKAILHRKNALFFKTLNGARIADIFMSLIHTTELARVEPFDYLVTLQRHAAAVLLQPAAWMPWNYTEALARLQAHHPADSARD